MEGMNSRLSSCLLVLALILAGCGSDDGATTSQAGPTSDGSGSSDGGQGAGSELPESGDLPESLADDFAVAIAPGWEFDILGDIGMTNTTGAQLLYPQDAFDEVVAFYDDWTASQAVDYTRTEIDDDVVYQSTETPIIVITVSANYEERDQVFTYLLIATSGG